MLLSWWPKSHSSALTATRGKIHTRPWRQTEGAADTSEPRIGFSFCGDGSISRPNGYIIGQCVFLSNEAWEFSVYLKLALNTDCQSRRKGSSPVRLAIFYLQAISVGSEMRENLTVTSCVGIHVSVCVYTTNGSRWELWNHVPHRKLSTWSRTHTSPMLIRPFLHLFWSVPAKGRLHAYVSMFTSAEGSVSHQTT